MAIGTCSNCGREASDLRKCTGKCGGDAMYCNKSCQKEDRALHKKICPAKTKVAQSLTFEMPPWQDGFPDAPVCAARRMDGYGGSGLTLLFSDHKGIEPLLPYAKFQFPSDCEDDDGYPDEYAARKTAKWMGEGNHPFEPYVTTPTDPSIMKLKPEEACFNTEKYPEAVKRLLANGIITDTGKRLQVGYYKEKFPICRIHAPQTNNLEEVQRQRKDRWIC